MKLLQALTKETQPLKVVYLQKTEQWAKANFAEAVKIAAWKAIDWCKYFNLTPETANAHMPVSHQFPSMPTGFYNSRDARRKRNMEREANSIKRLGLEGYTAKQLERAEQHYACSLEKLVARLMTKGVDERKKVKIVSGWIGVNFEVVITVGEVCVKAWTIIASGPIQQPHYRYLIK
jgi:hypothetical protein